MVDFDGPMKMVQAHTVCVIAVMNLYHGQVEATLNAQLKATPTCMSQSYVDPFLKLN